MLRVPNEPLPGQAVTAADIAGMVRYLKQCTPRKSIGQLRRMGSGGFTTRSLARPSAPAVPAVGAAPKPFDLLSALPVDGDLTGASGYKATFQPGDINANLFPVIGSTPMWALVGTTVDGVTTYALPPLTVHKGDTVFLQGTVTAGLLTAVALMSAAVVTAETDSITTNIIGTCDPSTGAWTQIKDGNQKYQAQVQFYSSTGRALTHVWSTTAG